MNKLLAIFLIAISTTTMAVEVVTFADVQQAHAENPDKSIRLIGGAVALQDACNLNLTDFGTQSVEFVMKDTTTQNNFFQEGYNMVSEKVETWGCWMSKIVIRGNAVGKKFFN